MKKLVLGFMVMMMLMTVSACKRDVYGDIFINRDPVTFHVKSNDGQSLSKVSLKTEELDGFDYELIIDGTHYAFTDDNGMVTVDAACNNPEPLGERTTRFTFTATGFVSFDTIFNNWEDTVDIVLSKE